MAKHYSPSANAFYDDGIFGTRQIVVIDEDAQQAALAALTAEEFPPEEELPEGEEAPEPTEKERQAEIARLFDISARRKELLDNPPLMTIDNPDCRLPEDAIEISNEKHGELMAAQADGKKIVAGTGGQPAIAERTITAEEAIAAARSARGKALAASDYTQLPDVLTAAKRKAWAAHRKHLRDLPARIEEAIGKGMAPDEALALVTRNVDATRPG